MTEDTLDPKALAKSVAVVSADEPGDVGDFASQVELGDNVTDFRFTCRRRGYEGWQWAVTLYHDEEQDRWTVNESSLVPTDDSLVAPAWVPWKDRLEAEDISVTDALGTDPDDSRMEDGFRRTGPAQGESSADDGKVTGSDDGANTGKAGTGATPEGKPADATGGNGKDIDPETGLSIDAEEAIEDFHLSRRHVMSPLGRSQTAKRWYEGQHGPKSLSTKTGGGNLCSTCAFFIGLKGDLDTMFGVCANRWSPDDGRVVSIDHGCGEHSEIEEAEPTRLWVQSKPAFDDLHIDIIAQKPREERGQVELIESLDGDEDDESADDDDIERHAVPASEADRDDVSDDDAAPSEVSAVTDVESTIDLAAGDGSDDDGSDDDVEGDDGDADDESNATDGADDDDTDDADDTDDSDDESDGVDEADNADDDADGKAATTAPSNGSGDVEDDADDTAGTHADTDTDTDTDTDPDTDDTDTSDATDADISATADTAPADDAPGDE